IASGLPQDYLDSELKILSNLEVILRLKKGFELRICPSFCSCLVKNEVLRDYNLPLPIKYLLFRNQLSCIISIKD
ncbi:MAG: hypothetical protein ABSG48_03080, partial [Geobacteraceae bacterium]